MDQLPDGLLPLAQYHQFIIWQSIPDTPKPRKVPINVATMQPHDPHDPAIWMPAQTAIDTAKVLGDGYAVGFTFTKADPFWFLDIDGTTESPLVDMFAGGAIEISQSGNGMHIFGTGDCPPHSTRDNANNLEFYTEKRFVALTGDMVGDGSADFDATLLLPWLVENHFSYTPGAEISNWTTAPDPNWLGPPDDDILIAKFCASVSVAQAFGGKWTNEQLFKGPLEAGYDPSSADMSLASRLAFWTGKDCERIERLMRRSQLMRDKWDRRERQPGYLKTTILKSVALCQDVYRSGPPVSSTPPVQGDGASAPPPDGKTGYQLMTPEQQLEYFKGCVYVGNTHSVWVPGYDHLKPDQFKTKFGGYDFAMDSMNQKNTDNAWKAFTESQAIKFPKVHSACFRPKEKTGKIIIEEGRESVNVYEPIKTPQKKGDPSPFLNWLALVLPDEQDRRILLCYMASLIQNPGVKFQWAPLIQGMEGNGKSMITQIMGSCVGWRYTHLPKASDLAGNGLKFNGWMLYKLLIIIEEIYTAERHQTTEAMKPMITDSRLEVQQKGRDQIVVDTFFNTLLMTNHKDAIRTTFDHRRYCIFYMAQQSFQDLRRDGMVGDFFPYLYNWLRKEGFMIMNHYLRNYKVADELNPATLCQRAPLTTSTTEAVTMSLGGIEQEIVDAIDEGRTGFAGGWVSSIMLNKLLDSLRATGKIPQNKRREMMQSLGYDWHPHLRDGRVNNPLPQEDGKPKLFAQINHINNSITSASDVVRAYCKAQGYAPQFSKENTA